MGAPIRSYCAVIFVALVGTLQHGYHHSVYNQPQWIMMQYMNNSFNALNGYRPTEDLLAVLWSLTVSLFAGGLLFGSVCGSAVVIDRFGRKPALVIASITCVVGCIFQMISFWTIHFWLIPLGRFIVGVAIGKRSFRPVLQLVIANYSICFRGLPTEAKFYAGIQMFNKLYKWILGVGTNSQAVFLSEVAPIEQRGLFGVMATFFLAFGTLVANIFGRPDVLGTVDRWYALSIVPLVLALVFLAFSYFLYESPKFLAVRRKRDDLAMDSLRFYNTKGRELDSVLEAIKGEATQEGGLKGLIDLARNYPGYRVAFLVAYAGSFLVPFCGVFLMYSYLADVSKAAGLSDNAVDLLSIVYPCIDIICNLIGAWLIDRLGRRPMAIFGSWTVTGCLTIICVSQIVMENGLGNAQIAQIFVIVGVISHVIVKASSIAGVSFVLPYEIFPTPVRGAVASYICALGVDFGDLLLLFGYLPLKEKVGGFSLLILFILPMIVIATILTLYCPETKNKHVSEIYHSLLMARKHTIMGSDVDDDEDEKAKIVPDNDDKEYGTFDDEKKPLLDEKEPKLF